MALPSLAARVRTSEDRAATSPVLPTLFRFLLVIGVLAGLTYAAMFALATLIEPEPREMTSTIPTSRLPPR